MSNKKKWDCFKKQMTNSRKGENRKITTTSTITVQRLSESVEGKCQKYQRLGPLTMVKIETDITFDSIKEACLDQFSLSPSKYGCDIMAGERGPSLFDIGQIKNLNKVLHIRFFRTSTDSSESFVPQRGPAYLTKECEGAHRKKQKVEFADSTIEVSSTLSNSKMDGSESPKYPVSVSLSQMLNLGKLIKPENSQREVLDVHMETFDISLNKWSLPEDVKLSVSTESFAKGGFRAAYHASSVTGLSQFSKYVVKKYLPNQIPNINAIFGSVENHTRKAIQMNELAANFALSLKFESPPDYGECFSYNPVYFGKLETGECITIEKYINGDFKKYVNNTGSIVEVDCDDNEIAMKAATFVHFTYVKSKKTLMVVDIQGSGYTLYDPEVATAQLSEADGEVFFCLGNLSSVAIDNFIELHTCNRYCEMLGLISSQ